MSGLIENTDFVHVEGKSCLVKQAKIDTASAGANELVAAVAAKKIRVIALTLVCAAAQAVTFKTATTALTGAMSFAANGGMDINRTPPNYFLETVAGEALNLTLANAVQVSGTLNYILL